mmetsp:Transcript_21507/g.36939  ORF Transcript_21507/g.36939 Transcript_21507/m.36939 type:complete len:152 (-) Transcript_21507:177-632(-)
MPSHVRFSDSSTLYLYREDPTYANSKSYTAFDNESFRRDALREVMHIKVLLANIATSNSSIDNYENAVRILGALHEDVLVLGLESFILESPSKICQRRQAHCTIVLIEQESQKSSGDGNSDRLVDISATMSARCVSKARIRAAGAAQIDGL